MTTGSTLGRDSDEDYEGARRLVMVVDVFLVGKSRAVVSDREVAGRQQPPV
jgi:hypothetical protein